MCPSIIVLLLERFNSCASAVQHNCSVLEGNAELIRLKSRKLDYNYYLVAQESQ